MGIFFKSSKEERQKMNEERKKRHKEKIEQNNKDFEEKKAKIEADKLAIHRKYEAKRLGVTLKLPQYGVTLEHFSGLSDVAKSASVKVEANSKEQLLIIQSSPVLLQIPYMDILSSNLSTDVEVPEDDYTTKYMFYIHIRYQKNGNENEIVFSNFQDKSVHIRDIIGLDYILNHLHIKIEEFEQKIQDVASWNAKFDQRNAELKAQRERLIEKRANLSNNSVKKPAPAPNPINSNEPDITVELRKLKALMEEGLISAEDFENKKEQLLGL